jgi:N-methylhydantoinase A
MIEIVEENMANAARVHAIERGQTTAQCTLIAFGGAAPLHAASMARRLDIHQVVIPKDAGVGSAVGFLLSPLAFELVRSLYVDERKLEFSRINGLLDDLQGQASAIVRAGAPAAAVLVRRWVDVRYRGQGHELSIELPAGTLDAQAMTGLREDFERRYERQYGLRIPGVALEFLSWTVAASAEGSQAPAAVPQACTATAAQPLGQSEVFDPHSGQWQAHAIYEREALSPGAWLAGPALVREAQTTTLVPAGWRASLDGLGHLHLLRSQA